MQERKRVRFALVTFAVLSLALLGLIAYRRAEGLRLVRRLPSHPDRYAVRFETMGTIGNIVVVAPSREDAERWVRAAMVEIQSINESMSTYRPDSELSRLNREAAGGPVEVSPRLWRVIEFSVKLSERTGGAFDVSYSPLRDLWRTASARDSLPTREEIEAARAKTGWRNLRLDPEKRTVAFAVPGMKLDLGAVAKGYALDLAVEAMVREGMKQGFVDLGGDLRVVGRAETGRAWAVGVRDPLKPAEKTAITDKLYLADAAVATSGNYERHFNVGGKLYSHIIDPATGWPVTEVISATVIAPTGMESDGLATAVSVLGMDKGLKLIEETPDAECLLIAMRDGQPVQKRSAGFDAYEKQTP